MNKKGFTLIELLVVIAIIGLLSTLAIVALGNARQKARDSKRLADVKQIQTALELYFTDNNSYPLGDDTDADDNMGQNNYGCLDDTGFHDVDGCSGTVYMGLVPLDPQSGSGSNYQYFSNEPPASAGTDYSILFSLEGTVSGLSGTVSATPSGMRQK